MRYYDDQLEDEHVSNCGTSVSSVSLDDENYLELSSGSIRYPTTKPLPKSGATSQGGNSLIKDHNVKRGRRSYIDKEPFPLFQQRYSSNLVIPSSQLKSHTPYSSFTSSSPPPTRYVPSIKHYKPYENNFLSSQNRSKVSTLSTPKRTYYPPPRQSCLSPERNTKFQRFLLSSDNHNPSWQQYNLSQGKTQSLKPFTPLSVVHSYDNEDETLTTTTPPKSKRYHYSDGELLELEEDILSNNYSKQKQIPPRRNHNDHVSSLSSSSSSSNSTRRITDRQFEELEEEILLQSKDKPKTFSNFTEAELKELEDYFLKPPLDSSPFLNDELR